MCNFTGAAGTILEKKETVVCFYCRGPLTRVDEEVATGVLECANPECDKTIWLENIGSPDPTLRCSHCGARDFANYRGGLGRQKWYCAREPSHFIFWTVGLPKKAQATPQ